MQRKIKIKPIPPETEFLIKCRTLAAEHRAEQLQKEKDKLEWERLVQPHSD